MNLRLLSAVSLIFLLAFCIVGCNQGTDEPPKVERTDLNIEIDAEVE